MQHLIFFLLLLTLPWSIAHTEEKSKKFDLSPPFVIDKSRSFRPALAIRFSLQSSTAKVEVVHNILFKEDEKPRFKGFRFYKFSVPTDGKTHHVGWKPGNSKFEKEVYRSRTFIMNGKRFKYVSVSMDRRENGTMVITPLKGTNSYRFEGVYCYLGQVYIFDKVMKVGEPLILQEKDPNKTPKAQDKPVP